MGKPALSPEKFSTFGDLLKYLRKREELTQREFAIQVGYSDTQISRLEQNQRVPDAATLKALFVPALHLQDEPLWVERLLELAIYMLGRDQRDPQRSREQWEEAIVLFRQIGDWRFLAQTLGILGCTVLSNGDLEAAEKYLDEAYEVNQQINNIELEYVLTGKGILCMLRGEYDQARTFLQKNIENHEKTGNRMGYLWGRARLGHVALREGSVAEAHAILVDTIENFHADQNKNGLAFALDTMARLYVVTDKPAVAAHLIGSSDATRKDIGDPRPRIEQSDLDRDIAAIIAKIHAAGFEAAYAAGQAMTLDEVVALALGLRKQA